MADTISWMDTYCTHPDDSRREKAKAAFQNLYQSLLNDGWGTPDTYSNHFIDIPHSPGIYLFLAQDRFWMQGGFVAYVGMSERLTQRIGTLDRHVAHPVRKKIEKDDFWAQRWIKATNLNSLRDQERFYIDKFNPPYNIQWRRRGIFQ